MKRIVVLCLSLACAINAASAQNNGILQQVTGKYWAYENSVWDANKNPVHTFVERVNEGQVIAKGSGILFDNDGIFREAADETKIGSKPGTGTWVREGDSTLKVTYKGEVWHYKILQVKDGTMVVSINGSKQRQPSSKPKSAAKQH